MAAPAVSGVASLILSYFPRITAQKLKSIILESGLKVDIKINHDEKEKISIEKVVTLALKKISKGLLEIQ